MVITSQSEHETLISPWKMVAEYEDGERLYFYGDSEDDCVVAILKQEARHGECAWYMGYSPVNI